MAHRYWRARSLISYLRLPIVELSEFWLMAGGVRVDGGATLTSDEAPVSGLLSALGDADLGTSCTLPTTATLMWDFGGSPVEVEDIRLGSASSLSLFLAACIIEWSDDGLVWGEFRWGEPYQMPMVFAWPGERTLTSTSYMGGWSAEFISAISILYPNTNQADTLGTKSYRIRGEAAASQGVRQFEISASDWGSFTGLGVVRKGLDVTGASSSGNAWFVRPWENTKYSLGSGASAFPMGGWTTTSVFGMVVDFTTGEASVYKDGVLCGVAFTTLAGEVVVPLSTSASATTILTLRTRNFLYPVAGALPWAVETIAPSTIPFLPPSLRSEGHGEPPLYSGVNVEKLYFGRRNYNYDGLGGEGGAGGFNGKIEGTVKVDGDPSDVPVARLVRLHREADGTVLAETWSDPVTGEYGFYYIQRGLRYTVITYDHTHHMRAVAANSLFAEEM